MKTSEQNAKGGNTGCGILFLLALIVCDSVGVLIPMAGRYGQPVAILGLGGFACGAAFGIYLSIRVKQERWWSSCRWAFYGLLGSWLTTGVAVWIVLRWL
jgi:hypothetical protein